MDKQPMFSVILPVCHGGRFLESALSSLQNVTAPADGFEVIVSGTCETAAATFNRHAGPGWWFVESRGNRSEALNAACEAARGQYWVFSDDDCVFPADWLMNLDRFLAENPDTAIAGGVDCPTGGAGGFDAALDVVLNAWMGTGGTRTNRILKAGQYYPKLWNMTVRADDAKRAALDGAGGRLIYDSSLPVHEDVDLADRIRARGGEVSFASAVSVLHSRDTTYGAFVRRNLAMAHMCRQKKIHRIPHAALAAVIVGIPVLGITAVLFPVFKAAFGMASGLYIACALATGVKGAFGKKRTSLLFRVPLLIFSMHAARTAGFLQSPRSSYGSNL